MFKNYFLLSLKVLRRKPFYTFISLFGISFTLMVLLLMTALGDASLGNNRPVTDADRFVIVHRLDRYTPEYDTIYTVDSVYEAGGGVLYDTLDVKTEETSRSMSGSRMSYAFADRELRELDGVAEQTIFAAGMRADVYKEGQRYSFYQMLTDAEYWEIFDFEFLEGAPYVREDVASGNPIAILTDKAAVKYFGETAVIGRELVLNDRSYTIHGVVAAPVHQDDLVGGDIFTPMTAERSFDKNSPDLQGNFMSVLLTDAPADRDKVVAQLAFLSEEFEMPATETRFENIEVHAANSVEFFAMRTMSSHEPKKAVRQLFIPLAILLILFIVLPLVNLINLSVGRLHERASEIAVRKAFGADSRDVLTQFLFENLILTLIGGVIGGALAWLTAWYLNENEVISGTQLALSPAVFILGLLVIVFFGLLSGLWPAYRMSRLRIAQSLR